MAKNHLYFVMTFLKDYHFKSIRSQFPLVLVSIKDNYVKINEHVIVYSCIDIKVILLSSVYLHMTY